MKQRVLALILGLFGLVALVVISWRWSGTPTEPHHGEIGVHIPNLKRQVEEERERAGKSVADYNPSTLGRIDNLATPATELLRQLPAVVEVEAPPPFKKATHRLVHLRDWHFVPRDLYALDMTAAYKRPLSEREIDLLHEELLLEVDLVQIEQMAVLRCLIKHHGLKRVVAEGRAIALICRGNREGRVRGRYHPTRLSAACS